MGVQAETAAPAEAPRGSSIAPWVALGVLTALAAALALYMGRGLTFYRDEWTFVLYRDGHDLKNFLSNYAGHLLLWPTGIYALLFRVAGLDHYWAFRAATLPWHLLCGVLVYLLARRRIGDLAALAPAGLLLFLGAAWADILWPFQIAFTGAIAFGLAALLLLDRDDPRGDLLACGCLLVALGWSGAGLPFVPGVAVGLFLGRRLWRRIWVIGAPTAAYLLWLFYAGGEEIDYASNIARLPNYVLHMVGAGITGVWGLHYAWGVYLVVLAAVVVAVRLRQLGRDAVLAWQALAMGASFWVLTAISRAQESDPQAVRYVYPTVVFLLLLAVGLAPRRVPGRLATAVVFALALLALPANLSGFEEGREGLVFTSNVTTAELGALELARETVAPGFAPEMNGFKGAVPAAAFFRATKRYGSSPADSAAQIAAAPNYARRRADRTSIQALPIRIEKPPAGLRLGRCTTLQGTGFSRGMVLPRGGVVIPAPRGAEGQVVMRRFASTFLGPIPTSVPRGRPSLLRAPPDAERSRPWRFAVSVDYGPVRVCRVSRGG